jgi:hypothetical protein
MPLYLGNSSWPLSLIVCHTAGFLPGHKGNLQTAAYFSTSAAKIHPAGQLNKVVKNKKDCFA